MDSFQKLRLGFFLCGNIGFTCQVSRYQQVWRDFQVRALSGSLVKAAPPSRGTPHLGEGLEVDEMLPLPPALPPGFIVRILH